MCLSEAGNEHDATHLSPKKIHEHENARGTKLWHNNNHNNRHSHSRSLCRQSSSERAKERTCVPHTEREIEIWKLRTRFEISAKTKSQKFARGFCPFLSATDVRGNWNRYFRVIASSITDIRYPCKRSLCYVAGRPAPLIRALLDLYWKYI